MQRTSTQIGLLIDELEKEYQSIAENKHVVEQEYSRLGREILEVEKLKADLKFRRSEYSGLLQQARFELKAIEMKLSGEKRQYYAVKNSGL